MSVFLLNSFDNAQEGEMSDVASFGADNTFSPLTTVRSRDGENGLKRKHSPEAEVKTLIIKQRRSVPPTIGDPLTAKPETDVYIENEVVISAPSSSSENGVQGLSDASQALLQFWPKVTEEIRQIENMDIRGAALPLARIKKIMKLDEDVKMISAEAPVLFAKAAELFIQEITLRSWVHTEDNKRRTLQRNDIAMAITKYDQFDFLIDIVPREEARPGNRSQVSLDQVHYYLHLNQQQQAQQQAEEEEEADRSMQVIQQPVAVATPPSPDKQQVTTGNIQVLQQIVGPNGEIQHVPVQVPERQMELIRLQVEGSAPIVLSPQVLQSRQPNPVFIQMMQQN